MQLRRVVQSAIFRTTGRVLVDPARFDVVEKCTTPAIDIEPMPEHGWFGDYPSFEVAAAECTGYDTETIATAVRSQRAASISGAISHIDERLLEPLAALSLAVNRLGKSRISVLDFGGGNGFFAEVARHFLPQVTFDWSVLETPSMVGACGTIEGIRWLTDIPKETFDVVLLCGVLQAVPAPYDTLATCAALAPWLVLQRVPLGPAHRITIQVVPVHLYNGSYPHTFLSETEFIEALNQAGTIVTTWTVEVERNTYPFGTTPRGFLLQTS
jgi:putative methyltransferase (TIGR04325 family)